MSQSAMQRYRDEEVILRQGGEGRELFKILSGKAVVYFNYGEADEHVIGVLSEHRCFGELSLLCGKPSTYTVVAYGEVLVHRITQDSFFDFIKNNPRNAVEMMENLANSIETLSLNVNLLTEELAAAAGAQLDPQRVQDISLRMRRCASLEAIRHELFSASI